jgi:hypothetical protein
MEHIKLGLGVGIAHTVGLHAVNPFIYRNRDQDSMAPGRTM